MHTQKIENLLKLSGKERYQYFVRKVADFEIVWGLFDDGWAMAEDVNGKKALIFWPEKELAEICAIDEWKNYVTKSIELGKFIDKWIPGMKKDNLSVAIFPTIFDSAVVVESSYLKKSIEDELYLLE